MHSIRHRSRMPPPRYPLRITATIGRRGATNRHIDSVPSHLLLYPTAAPIAAKESNMQVITKVTTRPRGEIPNCKGCSNEHTFPHDQRNKARTNAWLSQMRADHLQWQRLYADIRARREA